MGLDKLIDKIQNDASDEIRSIESEAKKQADIILETANRESKELSEKKKNDTTKQINNMLIQEMSSAELEAKKLYLYAQREILETTYKECLEALDSIQHNKALISIISKAKKEMPEAVYVYSNKRDEQIVRTVSGLAYSGNVDCIGGIIVENSNKTLRLDYRYETIAALVWEKNIKEIAKILLR